MFKKILYIILLLLVSSCTKQEGPLLSSSSEMMTMPAGSAKSKHAATPQERLGDASIVFAMPTEANINDQINAELLIDPIKEVNQLADQLSDDLKSKIIEKKKIKISKVLIAKLTAIDFTVTNITPEEQVVTENSPTQWLWELQPKTAGKHSVELTVTAVFKINGEDSVHTLRTFAKVIQVDITTKQIISAWLNQYWQWILSSLILPLALFFLKGRLNKKELPDDDS